MVLPKRKVIPVRYIGFLFTAITSKYSTIMSVAIGIPLLPPTLYAGVKHHRPWSVLGWVTVLVCQFLLIVLRMRRQYEFSFGINIVKFSFSIFIFSGAKISQKRQSVKTYQAITHIDKSTVKN